MATEYVIVLGVALAAVSAMAVLGKRAIQGKLFDARMHMTDSVRGAVQTLNDRGYMAEGTVLYSGYEPYYTLTNSVVASNSVDTYRLTVDPDTGPTAVKETDASSRIETTSVQLPPGEGEETP